MSLIGKMISSIVISFVQNLEEFLSLSWFDIQECGHTPALSFYSYHTLQRLVLPETPCCLSIKKIQADFAPSFSEEAPI